MSTRNCARGCFGRTPSFNGDLHIVKRKDEAAYGEYRTKRVILEVYDAMQRAMDTGEPYQALLDPPPAADPRVAHPPHKT